MHHQSHRTHAAAAPAALALCPAEIVNPHADGPQAVDTTPVAGAFGAVIHVFQRVCEHTKGSEKMFELAKEIGAKANSNAMTSKTKIFFIGAIVAATRRGGSGAC